MPCSQQKQRKRGIHHGFNRNSKRTGIFRCSDHGYDLVFKPEYRVFCEENRCGNYDLNPACPPESGTVEEMKKHAMKYEKALVLQTMQEYSMDFKKAKVAHNKLTEALAERMKEDGKTDLLLMTAGPYKHNSCMSAYCVDAQMMADAVGMTCWANDDKVRYFSLYRKFLKSEK